MPAPADRSARRTRRLLTSVLLLVLLAVLAVAALAGTILLQERYGSVAAAWTATFMPPELAGAVFVGTDANGAPIAYQYQRGNYRSRPLPLGTIGIAESKAHEALLVAHPSYYQILLDGNTVAESSTTLAYISLSAEGNWIGASEAAVPAASSSGVGIEPLVTGNARGWSIVLFSTTRPKATVAPGSAPAFVDGRLVWLDPRGLVGMRLDEGFERVLDATHSASLVAPLLVSPDGSMIALRDMAARRILVYRVDAESTQQIASVPDRGAWSFALGDDGVYLVRVAPGAGTEIWKEPFDGHASRIATLPPSLRVTRLFLPTP